MNNIKTESEVYAWAETIVNGKGDKYIPLGKADMFAIAEFVVKYSPSEPLQEIPPPPTGPEAEPRAEKPSPDKAVGVVAEADPVEVELSAERNFSTTSTSGGPAVTKVTMTRGYALHRAGFSTQAAYDKFLEWCKEHPKEGMVMDFSTGVKSTNAAFAYWLMENIVVEVPTSEMRAYNY